MVGWGIGPSDNMRAMRLFSDYRIWYTLDNYMPLQTKLNTWEDSLCFKDRMRWGWEQPMGIPHIGRKLHPTVNTWRILYIQGRGSTNPTGNRKGRNSLQWISYHPYIEVQHIPLPAVRITQFAGNIHDLPTCGVWGARHNSYTYE